MAVFLSYRLNMTNQTNISLLETLTENYKTYLALALRIGRTKELADDLVQSVAYKLLTNEITLYNNITNHNMISTMLYQFRYTHLKKSAKYMTYDTFEDYIFSVDQAHIKSGGCSYSEDLELSFEKRDQIKKVKDAIKDLKPKQKEAIVNALDGYELGEREHPQVTNVSKIPQYNSLKTNKRIAIQVIKQKLS